MKGKPLLFSQVPPPHPTLAATQGKVLAIFRDGSGQHPGAVTTEQVENKFHVTTLANGREGVNRMNWSWAVNYIPPQWVPDLSQRIRLRCVAKLT